MAFKSSKSAHVGLKTAKLRRARRPRLASRNKLVKSLEPQWHQANYPGAWPRATVASGKNSSKPGRPHREREREGEREKYYTYPAT